MNRFLAASLTLALFACEPIDENGDGVSDGVVKPDTVSQVAASKAVGTVSGLVVSSSRAGVGGVSVTLVLGAGGEQPTYTTTTSDSGVFSFKHVPAGGTGTLLFEKAGYSSARTSVGIPAAAGNFPLNDANGDVGQISLSPLTSSVWFRVYTADGAPAAGANAFLEFPAASFDKSGSVAGRHTATAQVGADGVLRFDNVPDLAPLSQLTNTPVSLVVAAFDQNGDGTPDFHGHGASWPVSTLYTSAGFAPITLNRFESTAPLRIIGTNVASFNDGAGSPPYRNAVRGSDPVTVTFNQPVTSSGTAQLVTVLAEDCESTVGITVTQTSPFSLSVAPSGGAWEAGAEFNIAVRVTGVETGETNTYIGYFFGLDPATPKGVDSVSFRAFKPAGTMAMQTVFTPASDTLYAFFDAPVRDQGAGDAVVQFDLDINNNSNRQDCGEYQGTTTGEFQALCGLNLYADEPLTALRSTDSFFTCLPSGYTNRWVVQGTVQPALEQAMAALDVGQLSNPIPVDGGVCIIAASGVNTGVGIRVVVPQTSNSATTYQSAAGVPVKGIVPGSLLSVTIRQSPP